MSGVLLAVGLAVAIGTAVFAINRTIPYLDHTPTMSVPGSTHLTLERGTYVLFGRPVGDRYCAGASCFTFGPADVEVTSPSGSRVPVIADNTSDRFTQNERTYPAVAEFHVLRRGRYTVQVRSPTPTNVVIDPSPGQEFHAFAGWIALGVGGVLIAVSAIVCLVGASTTRRRLLYPVEASPSGTLRTLRAGPPAQRWAVAFVLLLVIVAVMTPAFGPLIAVAVAVTIVVLAVLLRARRRARQSH